MKAIDSSVWIEYFAAGPLAERLAPELADPLRLVTPTIVVHEVFRWVLRNRGEDRAAFAAGLLQQTRLVAIDEDLARHAAQLSVDRGLAMADALIYATARRHEVTLVTCDQDLAGLPGVEYHPKA